MKCGDKLRLGRKGFRGVARLRRKGKKGKEVLRGGK
jgi:hypothetical protein